MNKYKLTFAIITIGLVSACGGGGGGSPASPSGASAVNTGGAGGASSTSGASGLLTPLLPTGEPALVFRSVFQLGDQFGTLDEEIHLVVPTTGEKTKLLWNSSTSQSRSMIGARTFGDRLLLRRSDDGGFGRTDWTEVDIDANVERNGDDIVGFLPARASLSTTTGASLSNCVAAVGSTLYWQTPSDGLRSATLGASGVLAGTELLPAGDPNGCFGRNMSATGQPGPAAPVGGLNVSADARLLGLSFDADAGTIEALERDPASGLPSPIARVTMPDHSFYDRAYSLTVYDDIVYWVRIHAGNQQIELWSWDLIGQPQLVTVTEGMSINAAVVSQLDATDGYFVFMAGPSFTATNIVLTFDSSASAWFEIDLFNVVPPVGGFLPPRFDDLQIIRR